MNRRAAVLVTLSLILPACTRTPDTAGKQFMNGVAPDLFAFADGVFAGLR